MRSPLQVRQHIGCTVSSSQAKPRLLCTLPSCCQANKLSVSKRNSRVSSGTDPIKVSYTVRSFQVNKQAVLSERSDIHSSDGHSVGGCSGTSSISSVMGTPRTEAILSRVLKDTSCWGLWNIVCTVR